ncbi:MAG: hypothetical protein ACJ71G_19725 [Nitrososphaeraceae archaeon]
MNYNSLDFLSRDCRKNYHNECSGIWHGLGLEVYCYCNCHSKEEKQQASTWVERPVANAFGSVKPTQEKNLR